MGCTGVTRRLLMLARSTPCTNALYITASYHAVCVTDINVKNRITILKSHRRNKVITLKKFYVQFFVVLEAMFGFGPASGLGLKI